MCESLRVPAGDLEMMTWGQRPVGRGSRYSYFTKRNRDKVTDRNGNNLHQWRETSHANILVLRSLHPSLKNSGVVDKFILVSFAEFSKHNCP